MSFPEDLEKRVDSRSYTSRTSCTIYLLLPYAWWQLDDFFIGQARVAGLATHFKLNQLDSEELYTNTKFVLVAFAWLLLLWQVAGINIRKLALTITSLQVMLVLAQTLAPSTKFLLVIRSLLGIGGATFPGALLLSMPQLPSNNLTMAAAIFIAVSPAEVVLAGPLLSALVGSMRDMSVLSWQALFTIHGTIGLAVLITLWLKVPASIHAIPIAEFMTRNDSVEWKSKLKDFCDPKNFIFIAMFICCNLVAAQTPSYLAVHSRISFVSMPYFFFTVISDLGASHLVFNLLSIAPYLVSVIAILMIARMSDQKQVRGYFVAACSLLSVAGFSIMSLVAIFNWSLWWSFFAIFPACLGSYGAMTVILSWVLGNEQSIFQRGVLLTVLLGVAQLAAIFSPSGVKPWWRADDEPAHPRGLGVSAALMGSCAILALVLRSYLTWTNSSRVRQFYVPVKVGEALDDEADEQAVGECLI
ncbi:hypothetical protein ACMFMG_009968 [Clarireedia jacksonii]